MIKTMMENAVHLGHAPNRWNPQMKSFICLDKSKRIKISDKKETKVHVLDLVKTVAHLDYLKLRLAKAAQQEQTILFVGTDKGYGPVISKMAKACQAYYVNEKWLGGMLTNWKTINTSRENLLKFGVLIEEGVIDGMPKKEQARAYKVKHKLHRLLGGISYMMKKPDLVIVVGQLKEQKALKECKKLNIPSISISDTNCNPMASDMIVPANDDSMAGLQIIFNNLVHAVKRGQLLLAEKNKPRVFKRIYHKFPRLEPRYKRRKAKNQKNNKSKSKRSYTPKGPNYTPKGPKNPKTQSPKSKNPRRLQKPPTPLTPRSPKKPPKENTLKQDQEK